MENIVSVDWLKNHLNQDNLIVLDASFEKGEISIPGALFMGLKENFSDTESRFPNTFPSEEKFVEQARKLGVNNNSMLVVYDNKGIFSGPRAWWLFKVFGFDNISVLDGGLPAWIKSKGELAKGFSEPKYEGDLKSKFNHDFIITYQDVQGNMISNNFTLVDARSKGRFDGVDPEPRKGLKSGHVLNSINIPFTDLLIDGHFKPKSHLKKIFSTKLDGKQKLVFSCGSGITACIVLLASTMSFMDSKYVYDGSWTEWAEINELK